MNEVGITVKKGDNLPEWYSQVCLKAELGDYSSVKGVPVIRPYGYALWQKITDFFNERIQKLGVQNAYFPMFIPESFFKREAEHIAGFAPELAWIEKKNDSEERLAIRPTSETIMYDSYSKWIQSYRDLPLRINQWCNVVRWEVSDVKLFLRGREFLWQEGHCVYETEEETNKEVELMIEEYDYLSRELLAIPSVIGLKSKQETFAGAKYTYTIEQFMPDGKALQSGTTHNLGQGFAKVFGIQYRGRDEKMHTPWQSSWGFSTRLLGAIVMTHGDDKGLVLPPRLAPTKIVIVPITIKKNPELSEKVMTTGEDLRKQLIDAGFTTIFDSREEYSPGFKYNEWELKGIPLRIEIGPRDIENDSCMVVKRNTGVKQAVKLKELTKSIPALLDTMHEEMITKAKKIIDDNSTIAITYDELKEQIAKRHFVTAHHCANEECEAAIKAETGATTRCRPRKNDKPDKNAQCIRCKQPAAYKIIFAKNY